MRRAIFWTGWIIMFLAPIAAIVEVAIIQDMPQITAWKLAIPAIAAILILAGRNPDSVLKHHLA
jgi:hypothetical protein